ncbi:response regulator transcription factor [uncultured Flavobacterium sp.]|uniref:LytR/AlgR family response regulator transcription factor n=1 Tax=uncultured Flavobacterium sp. TaxID=165435 RepID=UPI0030EF4D58|tara:strand:- start:47425 stop:48411 length:987 start_codon:yes stop_codon:yes gene_type:complete
MAYKYIIIDGDSQSSISLQTHVSTLGDFYFSGYVNNAAEGLNLILEENPDVIFLGTNLTDSSTESNFTLINELYKYMVVLPKVVVVSNTKEVAYEAMKYDVYDFLLKPFQKIDIIKTLLKFKKENGFKSFLNQTAVNQIEKSQPVLSSSFVNHPAPVVEEKYAFKENGVEKELVKVDFQFDTEEIKNELIEIVKQSIESKPITVQTEQVIEQKNNILCVKSYGDYRFIEFDDIVYLKADNNSTDIMLNTGDSITAFKTLKYFESSLPNDFERIHNSHIINKKFVSRIHLGNSDCYLNKGKIKLPFSKSYKDNINAIIELYASNDSKDD